jgi:hypothetical protein
MKIDIIYSSSKKIATLHIIPENHDEEIILNFFKVGFKVPCQAYKVSKNSNDKDLIFDSLKIEINKKE